MTLEEVQTLREQMAEAGFAPIPLLTGDKAPKIARWADLAREDRAYFAKQAPRPDMLNTGMLCDGLRVVDIDIDDAETVQEIGRLAFKFLGEDGLLRTRSNSDRVAIVYRAAEGAPVKAVVSGARGKVEVLGRGQQLHAFGPHPSGGVLEWHPAAPGQIKVADIPAVADSQVDLFLRAASEVVGAEVQEELKPRPERPKAAPREASPPRGGLNLGYGTELDMMALRDALMAIPNGSNMDDWHAWNRIGMALWSATRGSGEGFALFDEWSRRHHSYNAEATRRRWEALSRSPPRDINAGSVFYAAYDHGWKGSHQAEAPKAANDQRSERVDPETGEVLEDDDELAVEPALPIDAASLPRRPWLSHGFLLRGHLSVLVAPPGVGKSLLSLQVAAAAATGGEWGGFGFRKKTRVLVLNIEDDATEQRRRLWAALDAMGIEQSAVADRILLASVEANELQIMRRDHRTREAVQTGLAERLIRTCRKRDVGLIVIDPLAETHSLEENSNDDIKAVAAAWRYVARSADVSLLAIHHTPKNSDGKAGDANAARGGGALVGVARVVSTLMPMGKDEAERFGLAENDRYRFVRFDDGKGNYSLKAEEKWFEKITKFLPNGHEAGLESEPGDQVGVLMPWTPPSVFSGLTDAMLARCLAMLAAGPMGPDGQPTGELYGEAGNLAPHRKIAPAVAASLGIDEARAKQVIKHWKTNGILTEGTFQAGHRKTGIGLRVSTQARAA